MTLQLTQMTKSMGFKSLEKMERFNCCCLKQHHHCSHFEPSTTYSYRIVVSLSVSLCHLSTILQTTTCWMLDCVVKRAAKGVDLRSTRIFLATCDMQRFDKPRKESCRG